MAGSEDMAIEPAGPELIAYRGKLIEIVHQDFYLPSGRKTFELARRGPGTRILVLRDDSLLITEEFRTEIGKVDLRLPGGKVFDSLTAYETALENREDISSLARDAAARELHEETGFRAVELIPFGISRCGATITWDLHYFSCKTGDFDGDRADRSIDEQIAVRWIHLDEVRTMCLDGRISEDRSALQILRYLETV